MDMLGKVARYSLVPVPYESSYLLYSEKVHFGARCSPFAKRVHVYNTDPVPLTVGFIL